MTKYISLIDSIRNFRSMTKNGLDSEQALSKSLNAREEANELWNLQCRIRSAEIGNSIINSLMRGGMDEAEALTLLGKFESCLREVF